MLDRTAKCLRPSPHPQWLSAPTKHARQLHSTFWRHGAGDLDLPAYCYKTVRNLFEPQVYADDDKSTPFLDFLYPPNTNHTLNRFTLSTLHTRLFSSSSPKTRTYSTHPSPQTNAQPTTLPPLDRLQMQLQRHARGDAQADPNDAWDAFAQIAGSQITIDLRKELMHLLAKHSNPVQARRLVRLFDRLPSSSRDPTAYNEAIHAHLKLDHIGKAILLHDQARDKHFLQDPINTTSLLLAYAFSHHHWQLAFRLWLALRQGTDGTDLDIDQWKPAFTARLSALPDFTRHLISLLQYVETYPALLTAHFKGFIRRTISWTFEAGGSFGPEGTLQVMHSLKRIKTSDKDRFYCYELACTSPFRMNISSDLRSKLVFDYYQVFRNDPSISPSMNLLRNLIKYAVDQRLQPQIDMLAADWNSHYGKFSRNPLISLMMWHASRGESDQVLAMMTDSMTKRELQDFTHFNLLLHADAMRGDHLAVRNRMQWMEDEYARKPDLQSWNILLHAYARCDDLNGAMDCMSWIDDAGFTPDHYTFGTIMSVAAARGETDLTESLTSLAEGLRVKKSDVMWETHVLAYVNDDELLKAEDLAVQAMPSTSSQSQTNAWTHVLAAYGVRNNFTAALRVSRRMRELKIVFDASTYAALMRVFTSNKQPRMARHIMRVLMPKEGLTPTAIHYAIVIDGYASELYIEAGLRLYAQMLESGIKQNLSTRAAMLKLQACSVENKAIGDTAMESSVRFDIPEELLEEYLNDDDPELRTNKDIQMNLKGDNAIDAHEYIYFDSLLELYGKAKAYESLKTLWQKWHDKVQSRSPDHTVSPRKPLRMLHGLMVLHYARRDFDLVQVLFDLASESALSLTAKSEKTRQASSSSKFLPAQSRYLLSRHLDIYLRCLNAQERYSSMLSVMRDMVKQGFALDYHNWNTYVKILAGEGHLREAFQVCEKRVLQDFPGWKSNERNPVWAIRSGRKSKGMQSIGQKFEFLRRGQLTVTFSTVIKLASEVKKLQRKATRDRSAQDELDEIGQESPKMMRTVLRLPSGNHMSHKRPAQNQ